MEVEMTSWKMNNETEKFRLNFPNRSTVTCALLKTNKTNVLSLHAQDKRIMTA